MEKKVACLLLVTITMTIAILAIANFNSNNVQSTSIVDDEGKLKDTDGDEESDFFASQPKNELEDKGHIFEGDGKKGTVESQNTSFVNDEGKLKDTDGDGMSDWFEINVAKLDPQVPNDRYLIYLKTDLINGPYDCKWCRASLDRFIYFNKFLPENVVIIENVTFADFKVAVDQLAERSDENDLVYVELNGHGAGPHREYNLIEEIEESELGKITKIRFTGGWVNITPFMVFVDEETQGEKRVTYEEIGKILNKIRCQKMLVVYSSCACNTGVEPLSNGSAYPRVVMGPTSMTMGLARSFGGTNIHINNKSVYSKISDEYLSVELLFQYNRRNYPDEKVNEEMVKVNESIEKGRILSIPGDEPGIDRQRVRMADPENLSATFYFGEAKVKDLYTR